ncbi:hypothetical protein Q9966_008656 [Columba livia]|nr:hypothetical protein Q9966_008656 [Columba livia]
MAWSIPLVRSGKMSQLCPLILPTPGLLAEVGGVGRDETLRLCKHCSKSQSRGVLPALF